MDFRNKTTLLSLCSMLFILGLAAGLDQWIRILEIQSRADFNAVSVWLVLNISILFLMGLCALLFRFVTCINKPKTFVSAIFFITGSSVLFYNLLALYVPSLTMSRYLTPYTLLTTVSAFIAVTGIITIIFPKR